MKTLTLREWFQNLNSITLPTRDFLNVLYHFELTVCDLVSFLSDSIELAKIKGIFMKSFFIPVFLKCCITILKSIKVQIVYKLIYHKLK